MSTDKCERVVLHIHHRDSVCNILLFAITTFLTTGRIQVQGNFYEEWISCEMPLLTSMVDKLQHEEETDELQVSVFFYESEDDLHTKDEVINYDLNSTNNNNACTLQHEDTDPTLNSEYRFRSECETHVVGGGQETTTSPIRFNTITTVKETVSLLERGMVEMHLRLDGQVTQEDMSD